MSTMLSTSSGRAFAHSSWPTTAYTRPRPSAASGSSCAEASTRDSIGSQANGWVSSSVRLIAALSTPNSTQPRGQPVRAGAGPPERSGVGGQARVQAVRDGRVDRLAPGVEQIGHQHGGRVRRRIDVVGGAEQLVGGVVVDDQHLAAACSARSRSAPSRLTLGMSTVTTRSASRRIASGATSRWPPGRRLQRFRQLGRRREADLDGLAASARAPAPGPGPRRWCRRPERHGRRR